jgi:hypothetical protein
MDIASGQQLNLTLSPSRSKSLQDEKLTHVNEIASKSTVKRSFDVAFLMLPDEKLKRRVINSSPEKEVSNYPFSELSVRSDLMNRYQNMTKIVSDQIEYKPESAGKLSEDIESAIHRSAFSKVSQLINVDIPVPPVELLFSQPTDLEQSTIFQLPTPLPPVLQRKCFPIARSIRIPVPGEIQTLRVPLWSQHDSSPQHGEQQGPQG